MIYSGASTFTRRRWSIQSDCAFSFVRWSSGLDHLLLIKLSCFCSIHARATIELFFVDVCLVLGGLLFSLSWNLRVAAVQGSVALSSSGARSEFDYLRRSSTASRFRLFLLSRFWRRCRHLRLQHRSVFLQFLMRHSQPRGERSMECRKYNTVGWRLSSSCGGVGEAPYSLFFYFFIFLSRWWIVDTGVELR